jgi:SEC-C motif-containing protein
MRSRYAAYATGRLDYVFRTWHPRTRPDDIDPSSGLTWTGLEIVATADGGVGDDTGTVEFRARYRTPQGSGELHEVSRFERRAGRWVYVDGVVDEG